ncbi:Ankyrin repeat-containing protein [Thalictrum thalictroides]|uniref:Ankyrin repeat-containing protein n=1 Tax=Thalictrum thalictroides TaxID=46969 RepID=A0A7J6W261_THATH|nr:Ankyrin repeat-containing protein [Thalictrum thalictroides]
MEELAGQSNLPRKKMTKQLTGKRGDTPLHSASRAGKLTEIKEIFSRTNDEDLKKLLMEQNQSGEIALFVAAEYGYVDVVVEMLKYYDIVSASVRAKNGYDAFHVAAKQGDLEVLKALQKAVPELSMTVDLSNTTALHTAATQGYIEVVNFLLELNGSIAKIAKNTGKTALHSAARNGHLEVVKSILDKDPSTATQTDKKGQTALHMAAKGQNTELFEVLTKLAPSLINVVDTKGNTALHIAARKGRTQILRKLLDHSETNTKAVNRAGETAIDTAEIFSNSEAMEHTRQTRKKMQEIAKQLNKMHAEGLNNAINSTTVVAVLIATVAFAAIFTVPGQYADDPKKIPTGLSLGEANIAPQLPFMIFFIFDSIALFISLAVVVVQTSVVAIESAAKKQMMAVINKLMWLACVLVSVAYLALAFIVVGKHKIWLAIGITIIGTTIMATTLGIMCYWVVMHRIEASNQRNIRKSSMGSRSRSWSLSAVSDADINEFKPMYAI